MSETPLSVRVNRLFALAHAEDAPEPTTEAVARSLTELLGRPVEAQTVQAIRDGDDPYGEPAVLAALAAYFHAPEQYLADSEYHEYDTLIRFKLAVRAAGVNHMSMRGDHTTEQAFTVSEMERLIPLLRALPDQFGTGTS